MSVRNDDNIIKYPGHPRRLHSRDADGLHGMRATATIRLAYGSSSSLHPRHSPRWFSVVMGIKTWLDEHGRK